MRPAAIIATMALVCVLVSVDASTDRPRGAGQPEVAGFRDWSASKEALVKRLLKALRQSDQDALRRLRVNETEYREIIVPGSVEPGEPPRQLVPEWVDLAWESLDMKSKGYEQYFLAGLGGRNLKVRALEFAEGEKEYSTYKAYRQLRLALIDDSGKDLRLETGSIAEIGGRYKFVSFAKK